MFLGGEPTVCGAEKLIKMAQVVWCKGFFPSISTNGLAEKTIKKIIPFFKWVQITIDNQSDVEKFRNNREKINLKLSGDSSLTMDKFRWFCKESKKFGRSSLSMYFTPDFRELCSDVEIWKLLDSLEWKKAGSYLYAFYDGVRIKRCIKGVTNIADEPQIPKLYPNGNYNKTWTNEDLDDYLHLFS